MGLKIYDSSNAASTGGERGMPCVSLYRKSGQFTLSRSACTRIGLKNGDQVKFAEDDEKKGEWYICKCDSGGFPVRGKTGGLTFANAVISAAMMAGIKNKDCKSVRMSLGALPVKISAAQWWTLDLSTAKIR